MAASQVCESRINKTFRKKPGTTDKGKDYEDILAAFLAFKFVNDINVENFNLSSNNEQFGCFDDIVLEFIENQEVTRICAIQLKNKENFKVKKNQLAASKGDFSLQKYFQCFRDIKIKYKQADLNCYLYTNAACEISDKYTFKFENKEHIKVSVRQIDLLDNELFSVSNNKSVYQFELQIENNETDDPESGEYEEFFKNFFFYFNQKNVDDMTSNALKLFKEEYDCEKLGFEKYMDFICRWSKIEDEKCCLNEEIVRFKIGECLLRPLAINGPLHCSGNSSKFGALQQAFLHFDATILQTDEEHVKRSLAEIFGQICYVDTNEACKIAKDFFIETKKDLSFNELDEDQKVTVLWYMNKLPLILQVDEKKNILKQAEKFCRQKKFIFIGKHIDRSDCQSLQIFQNLQDLPNDSSMYKKIVQETKISLQGRQVMSLDDLIRNYEEIEKEFTVFDLVNTTDGYLRVGEDKEELPQPYINQFLPKYVIDFEFLKQNNSESLSVINANQKSDIIRKKISGIKLVTVEKFLKEDQSEEVEANERFPNINKIFDTCKEKITHFDPIVLVTEDECSLEEFRRICYKSPNKPCHHFYINSDNNMEWIRSNGNIEDLKKYKSVSNYIPESEIFASFNSKINLITAKPGMGKTTLLKYLKNNIPTNYWVVNISLREHFLYFKEEHSSSEMLNYFLEDQAKRMKYSDFAIRIRNLFQSKRNIVFLWDGLDELPNSCLNEAFKAIEYSSYLGFINWITAREHLQPMLEEKFNVFALTIKEMEQEEQKSYIKKRLEAKYSEGKLEEFTQKIMDAIATTDGISFLGVPFHINILTELFLRDAEKYNNLLLNNTFTVADMMEYSVEEKFNFYYKEKCKCEDANVALGKILKEHTKTQMSQYESVALKTLLPTEDIVNCQQHLTSINLSEYDFGIIVGINDDRAIFVHNIYGEYFAASWMSKNLGLVQHFKRFFFEESYNNIRLIFDVILAKDCPAHLAILHNNFRSLRENSNETKLKDKAGRSPLHLACSWGEKRPVLPVEEMEDLLLIDDSQAKITKEDNDQHKEILSFLVEERKCDPFEKDNLFDWDCVEYAINSLCLLAVEAIADNHKLKLDALQPFNDCNIWYYGIRFGYLNLLERMETSVPYIELKGNRNNLLHEAVSYGRDEYLEKLLTNPIYLKHINKKNNNRVLVFGIKSTISHSRLKVLKSEDETLSMVKSGLEWIEEDNGVNLYSVLKATPLHLAAINGNSKAIQILLDRGADINFANNRTDNALHLATLSQHLDVVKFLIKNGASINETDICGSGILHMASRTGNCQLIEYIFEQNVPLTYNKFDTNPLHDVVYGNHMDALQIILKRINLLPRDERQSLGFSPFVYAIKQGRTEMVKYFVKNGININATERNTKSTPLHLAATNGHLEITSFLVENKANINVDDEKGLTPLYLAVRNGHTEIVKLLVQKGADLNKTYGEYSNNILHVFLQVTGNDVEILKVLIKHGADINLPNQNMATPLHFAVIAKRTDWARLLLQHGADPCAIAIAGLTPGKTAAIEICYSDMYQLIDSFVDLYLIFLTNLYLLYKYQYTYLNS